jgi:hypothetical protein
MSTETTAGVDRLANLIRTLDGNHDLGTGALAELLIEHGVVLYCIHPQLVRSAGRVPADMSGIYGYAATCPDCGNYWWSAGGRPEVKPARIAGIDPTVTAQEQV